MQDIQGNDNSLLWDTNTN